MVGSQPRFPDLRDKAWWEKNWNNSNSKLATELGCSIQSVHTWRKAMRARVFRRAGPLIGREAEEFVIGRIKENGGSAKHQDWGAPFDLLLGDMRIDVKSSSPRAITSTHPSPQYSFVLKKLNHQDCDFYIMVAKHPKEWVCFIIPSSAIDQEKSNIIFRWPVKDAKWNPWLDYLERWDLLGLLE